MICHRCKKEITDADKTQREIDNRNYCTQLCVDQDVWESWNYRGIVAKVFGGNYEED